MTRTQKMLAQSHTIRFLECVYILSMSLGCSKPISSLGYKKNLSQIPFVHQVLICLYRPLPLLLYHPVRFWCLLKMKSKKWEWRPNTAGFLEFRKSEQIGYNCKRVKCSTSLTPSCSNLLCSHGLQVNNFLHIDLIIIGETVLAAWVLQKYPLTRKCLS